MLIVSEGSIISIRTATCTPAGSWKFLFVPLFLYFFECCYCPEPSLYHAGGISWEIIRKCSLWRICHWLGQRTFPCAWIQLYIQVSRWWKGSFFKFLMSQFWQILSYSMEVKYRPVTGMVCLARWWTARLTSALLTSQSLLQELQHFPSACPGLTLVFPSSISSQGLRLHQCSPSWTLSPQMWDLKTEIPYKAKTLMFPGVYLHALSVCAGHHGYLRAGQVLPQPVGGAQQLCQRAWGVD